LRGKHFKAARRGVPARLWTTTEDRILNAVLIGTTEDDVVYAKPDSPGKLEGVVAVADVKRAAFEVTLDADALVEARRNRDDPALCRVLAAAYAPCYPFLNLPENNAVESVALLASTMMTVAGKTLRTAGTEEAKARADRQYEAASEVLVALAEARNWSPEGQIAVIKYCQCLLARGKVKTAAFHLDELEEPMPGDAAYGYYWLVRGLLAEKRDDPREALRAAILAVDCDPKNGEAFPAALLLSARAYEELEEWYRARDIYYEVATLFQSTDFGDDALARLRFILDHDKTKAPESDQTVENAFFGLAEDMNKLSRELLEKRAKAPAQP
jgi:tetratricopeptide (TPR) repeat protein